MSFTYLPPTGLSFSSSSSLSGTLSWMPSAPISPTVALLLHMDGTNGSTSFPDSSGNGLNAVASGSVSVSTSDFEFPTGSASFTNTQTGALAIPFTVGGPLDISIGDFTIEFWINAPAQLNFSSLLRFVMPGGASSNGPALLLDSPGSGGAGTLQITAEGDGSWTGSIISGTFPVNTWTHVAFVLDTASNLTNIYIGGVLTTSLPGWGHASMASNNGGVLNIGHAAFVDGGQGFQGFIDEFRLSRIAVYTSNFTPPTAPFSDGGVATDYDVYRNGVSIAHVVGALNFFDTVPVVGTYEYKVAAWDGVSTDTSDLSSPLDVTFSATVSTKTVYGKFVGSPVFPPTLLIDATGIKPRVYMPKENVTVKT